MSSPALLGCPHCTRPISFAAELAGKVVACPHCRKQLQMPATAPSPPPPPPRFNPATAPTSPGPSPRIELELQFPTTTEPPPAPDPRADGRPKVEPVWFRRTESLATACMWLGVVAVL